MTGAYTVHAPQTQ